jgi:hypothetical protein
MKQQLHQGKSAEELRRIFNISNESVSQQDDAFSEVAEGADMSS